MKYLNTDKANDTKEINDLFKNKNDDIFMVIYEKVKHNVTLNIHTKKN